MVLIDNNENLINDYYNISNIKLDVKNKYNKTNPALKIVFSENNDYNIKCIKKLIQLNEKNISFSTNFNGTNIKYILENASNEVINAIKAINISNLQEKYTFIYDCIFNDLDILWNSANPCKFCNNVCLASKNNQTAHKENGCCYSFDYSKNIFKFIDNVKLCKYLGEEKKCTTQNISCKLFVCNYLKKNKIFQINMQDNLLIQAFFNNKQKLILKYNFFRSKKEIIDKLLEKDNTPFFIYYINGYYRISKGKK